MLKKVLLLLIVSLSLQAIDIAVTFDDYPLPNGCLFTSQERTMRLLETCKKYNYKTVFFCVGQHIAEQKNSADLLKLANDNGHFLANHSVTHQKLSTISIDVLRSEIQQVDLLLQPYSNAKRWFRFPCLDYGHLPHLGGSPAKKIEAMEMLCALNYVHGYVSINTFDWHINDVLRKAIKERKTINYDALKAVYLNLIQEWCSFYINSYKKVFKIDVTHTLLLHANDLNALYLEDIFALIKENGWNLVSPEIAFSNNTRIKEIYAKATFDVIQAPLSLHIHDIDKVLTDYQVFLTKTPCL